MRRYFINDRDQIRYKKKPEKEFIFHINRNDRINEMQREAMNRMFSGTMLALRNASC